MSMPSVRPRVLALTVAASLVVAVGGFLVGRAAGDSGAPALEVAPLAQVEPRAAGDPIARPSRLAIPKDLGER